MARVPNNEIAEGLLGKLFDRWQGALGQPAKALTLCISGRDGKAYFATTGEERRSLHATLENAEKAGAVELKWGKHAASHELDRIRLLDGKMLADFLGRPSALSSVARLEQELQPALAVCAYGWIIETFGHACSFWSRGKPFKGLALPQDHIRATQLFQALLAVADGRHKGLDMRTFSARQLSDSKAFERLKSCFCAVWADHAGLEEWDNNDLLQTLGLEKELHPVLLRGPAVLRQGVLVTDLSCFQPYVGIPRELIGQVEMRNVPTYVLTIENLTSFFRYSREIQDGGLILFTHGFPNPDVQKFIGRLDIALPPETQFFHWGDTDVDGFGILDFIGKLALNHDIQPHLMGRDLWNECRPLNDFECKKLRRLNMHTRSISDLVGKLIANGVPNDFEQENIDPVPPLLVNQLIKF